MYVFITPKYTTNLRSRGQSFIVFYCIKYFYYSFLFGFIYVSSIYTYILFCYDHFSPSTCMCYSIIAFVRHSINRLFVCDMWQLHGTSMFSAHFWRLILGSKQLKLYASPCLWNQSLLHSINLVLFTHLLVHLILHISPHHSLQLCFHHLSLPLPFTPDLKLISFTNPFLHGHSYSFRTAFTDLEPVLN